MVAARSLQVTPNSGIPCGAGVAGGGRALALPNHWRHERAPWDAFVFVEDPDTLALEFESHDAVLHRPVADRDDGLRGFEVSDCDGYGLFFGRPL